MGRNERAFAVPMLSGLIGVVFALMIQLLNEGGIFIDEFITGTIVLRELQLIVIIIWISFGVLLSALQN